MSEQVTITTNDGDCPSWVFTPGDGGAHPGVILYMDAFGIRPAMFEMAQKIADHGYVVLVPDLFYRKGPYDEMDPTEIFASGKVGEVLGDFLSRTSPALAAEDSVAFIDYLTSRDDVSSPKVGTTGYCMGGRISLTVGGSLPDRVAAVASFHAAGVVGDAPGNATAVVPHIKGKVYVAGADHDAGYTEENQAQLEELLKQAGVEHRIEIYPEALHGFAVPDFPPNIYDEAAAERHWRETFALFDSALK
jgi:carboxymethylenebutenolidase